ncbi:GNAT family N-acetyltransferase [uncultured Limimaricola sp.]|uniref:GNAT family N-acetyltransferase n=1 Tax=uncultured Limimaricola sp. TaxID=2211667 RepID=UPI0030F73EA7
MKDETTAVRIAPITLDDVEGFRAALDSVARERRFLIFLEAPPPEAARAFVAANLREGNPQFVAHDGGRVVGWCDIQRSSHAVRAHCGTLGMGVVTGHRGRGIGRALLDATLEAARGAGVRRVELSAYASNLAAIALYERMGFRHEGRQRDAYRIDGRFEDAVSMALVWPEAAAG